MVCTNTHSRKYFFPTALTRVLVDAIADVKCIRPIWVISLTNPKGLKEKRSHSRILNKTDTEHSDNCSDCTRKQSRPQRRIWCVESMCDEKVGNQSKRERQGQRRDRQQGERGWAERVRDIQPSAATNSRSVLNLLR